MNENPPKQGLVGRSIPSTMFHGALGFFTMGAWWHVLTKRDIDRWNFETDRRLNKLSAELNKVNFTDNILSDIKNES